MKLDPEPAARLEATLGSMPQRSVVVALSGGADSIYLLHQATAWCRARGHPLQALHLNHGLRGEASEGDEAHCSATCARLGVPLRVLRMSGHLEPGNLQAQARNRLRQALRQSAGEGGWILLGHQAWDQSESVAAALLKGRLPWGLAGLSPQRGRWLRPLLDLGADEIRARCRSRGWTWREDASNASDAYERNCIRHKLLAPLRAQHGPGLDHLLAAIATGITGLLEQQRQLRDDLLENLDLSTEYCGLSLERARLFRYHDEVALAALEELGRRWGAWHRAPRRAALEGLLGWLRDGRPGRSRPVGGGWWVALDRRRAWFWTAAPPAPEGWLGPGDSLAGAGLRFGRSPQPAPPGAATFGLLPGETRRHLRLRPWHSGDRLRIAEQAHRSVADLLGEAGWNPLAKQRQPVLELDGELLWLPGCRRAWCPQGEQRKQSNHIIWMVA
jgi:tRNA(Ile)-lysidine synthetase-like protein